MGRELPILPSAPQVPQPTTQDAFVYARVFCGREDAPPLRLLLDFLKSRGQTPLIPKMDSAALDDWAWLQISIGYNRERKPIQLFCVRDRGSYKEMYEQEKADFLNRLSVFDDIEAELCREYVTRARFIATTQMVKGDITEDGYDFNGWILEFFQDQCQGIVHVDGHGFFSPRGDLIVEMPDLTSEIDTV
jgi:hypothetical protein